MTTQFTTYQLLMTEVCIRVFASYVRVFHRTFVNVIQAESDDGILVNGFYQFAISYCLQITKAELCKVLTQRIQNVGRK